MKYKYLLLFLVSFVGINVFGQAAPLIQVTIDTPLPACQLGDCTDLNAVYPSIKQTNDYAVSSIVYNPSFPYLWDGIGTHRIQVTGDDKFSQEITLPFSFCFYGVNYNKVLIGTNGVVTFTLTGWGAPDANGLVPCPWSYNTTIPNAAFPIKNAIYGVYQDTNMATPSPLADPLIQNVNYYFLDTGIHAAPNRVMVINFNELPQYSCNLSVGLQTSQIILYESTNIIDVNVQKRTTCIGWNGGRGLIGVQNAAGSAAKWPTTPNRNTGSWETTNESWRFTPSGSVVVPSAIVWKKNNVVVGNTNPFSVCPTGPATYEALVTYTPSCGSPFTVSETIDVDLEGPLPILDPLPINICNVVLPTTVNINQNTYMWNTQIPANFDLIYYENQSDAENDAANFITNLSAFPISTLPKTIYVRIFDTNSGCYNVRSFVISGGSPTGTIAYTPVTYCNTITTAQAITPSTLTPGGSYSSTPAGLLINPSTGAITPYGSTPGTYQVDYIITGSCPYSTSASVIIEPCVCTVVATNSGPICSDATSFNLFASSAGAGYSYSWTGPNGFTSNVQNPTGVPLPTGTPPFIYEVTATLGVDTCVGQTTLVINALPSITGTPTVCVNSTTQLTGSATPASTSPWTSSNTAIASVDSTGLVTGVAEGTATITYTNSNGCIVTKSVAVNALPTVSVNSPTVCIASSATITATPGISGSYDYVWTVPVGAINPGNVASFTAITPGIYGVTITRNNLLCNGDFDTLQVVSAGNNVDVNDAVFPCWKTTAPDHLIDVWGSGHASVDSYSGNQFIAFDTASSEILYQDFEVTPNATATISFAHRGRVGIDVMEVQIGPIGGPYTSLGIFSDAQTWQFHTLSYTFPSGTTFYRIRFIPISSAGGPAGGNFIDKVSLNINSCPSLTAFGTFVINPLPTITGTFTVCEGLSTQLTGSASPATTTPWTSSNTAVATVDSTGLVTGVAAGTTTITYTNSNGCLITQVVTVNTLPTITGNATICQGLTTQLTGSATPATTTPWTSSNTAVATVDSTGLVTGITAGTTTITYTNSNGCIATQVVTVNGTPTITGTFSVCEGLSTQLTGSATPSGTTPWTSSNTAIATVDSTGLVSALTIGTTTITYTNTNGCAITEVITVNGTPTITGTFTVCEGLSTQLTGSASPATTTPWTSSNTAVATVDSTGLVTGITSGTTTITYTNSNGCIITQVVTVNALPTITGNTAICQGLTTQLTGSATPATTTPWTSSNTAVATVDSTGLVTGITAGTTTITYTNTNGCTITEVITVNGTPTITGTFTVCEGLSTQLTGSASPATTTPWTSSNTAVATVDSTGLVTGITSGTTTITYMNSNGCLITQVVTVNTLPTITGNATICQGLTTLLTGSATPASTTPWTSSNTAVATVDSTGLVTGITAGTTTITYTNSNGCIATQVVTVNGTPTITGTFSVCEGLSTQLTGSATPSGTTPWTSSNTAIATVDSTGLVSALAIGTTTITYTNTNGCIVTQVVTINALPSITGTPTVCVNSTTQLTGSATPASTSPWTSSNTAIASVDSTGLVTGVAAGTTTITYTNSNGCIITQVVTVNALPTITGNTAICQGLTTQLTGSATPATTTPWTSSNTAVATVDSTGLVTGITAGTTTITYTNTNGCAITEVITVNGTPTITGTFTVCEGLSTQLTGSASPATTTPWTSSNTAVATVDSTGLVTGITSGTTTITYTNSNGCLITQVVTVNTLPTITGNATICQGLTTLLTGSATPASTTPWTSSNTAVATVDSTGLVTGITAGTTTITYTNSNGCIATTVVLVKSPPTVAVNSPIACLGATVTLTATSGLPGTYSYAWTVPPGAVPPGDVVSFTTSVAGTYSVILTDTVTTCSSTSASGIVTLNAIPLAVATPLGQTVCSGQTTGISLSSSVVGTVFNWTAVQVDATGATSDTGSIISQPLTATGLVPATVTYTVIPTANGCAGPATVVTITVMPTPVATATPVVQTICSGGTTAIALTSNLALPTFNWNVIQTGATGASAGSGSTINQVLSAIGNSVGEAVYSITPIVSGCPGTPITVSITVNPIPVITASPATATICSGATTNISLSSTLSGTIYNWSVIQTGVLGALPGSGSSISQTLTTVGILPGSAQYTITPITGGCVGLPITVTITVNPTPELFAFATAGICSGESPNITLSPNLPATTFAWTAVQTGVSGALDGVGASIDQVLTTTGTNPGTVVYTVTPSANSCTGTSVAITVTVDPLPLPAIQPGVICVEQSTGIAFQTYVLNTQLSGSTHTFVWYLDGVIVPGASGSSYEALEAGSYSVIATNNTTGCVSLPLSVTVSETFPGQGITTTQTLAFADNAEVTVDVIGTGVYEYQLDNGMFQSSNIFTNVGIGPHTIWVRDTDGCTDLTTTIYIIGYPHYFTPNGDGVHDQWNIIGLSNQPNAKIYIFDRYGKLIKQISPTSQGWDGTRNGEPLPATDYWFTVDYFEAGTDKVFKSHFSLKR